MKCPILSIKGGLRWKDRLPECIEEECAWYVKNLKMCAIPLIAGELFQINKFRLQPLKVEQK